MWGWPGLAALSQGVLVTALTGIIVFKIDRRSHVPGQDQGLRSPAEAELRPALNEASKQQELTLLSLEGMGNPPKIQGDLGELNLHPQLLWAGGSAEGRIIRASPADGF